MKSFVAILGTMAVALLLASPADAQTAKIKKGALTGILQSGSAMPAAGGVSEILTAKSGSYVVTQACITSADLHIQVTGLGELLCDRFLGGAGLTGCMKFEPGIALPNGSVVKCDNTGGSGVGACLVAVVEAQ
jgi:hypothetical protein